MANRKVHAPTKTKKASPASPGSLEARVYAVVKAVPRGRVATYGQVAELAGMHAGHRIVARAMKSCPKGLPWQRIVGKKDARRAKLNIQDPEHYRLQRKLLEREGVKFDESGCVSLRRFGWLPS
jgi:methylated-DNA-protein-cysteine methyltransferase-like protein